MSPAILASASLSDVESPVTDWRVAPSQLDLLAVTSIADDKTSSTFADNLSLPVHRWFRYSAGFSAEWVAKVIRQQTGVHKPRVFDPFAGSGTTLLAAESRGCEALGIEAHPFVQRVARAKLAWRESPKKFLSAAQTVLRLARTIKKETPNGAGLMQRCYAPETLRKLHALKSAWETHRGDSSVSELIWLALVSTLRECSHVGTAQCQYVLPNKRKAFVAEPFAAFQAKVELMALDMADRQASPAGNPASILAGDARECEEIADGWANLVITSPPYANNYDYADATRLEMVFWGEIDTWGELQSAVRSRLVRSCTQHVASLRQGLQQHLSESRLGPILPELTQVCARLVEVREQHGGKKPYHLMVAAYFADLARVWTALRRVCAYPSTVCFVVGDSAPYGVHVPVEEWLGRLAVAAGFHSYRFEKTRDRNVKWKNRKHRVPLQEGRLWVEG